MQASGAVEKWKHEQWKHALWNDQSHSLMGEFGISRCQENITTLRQLFGEVCWNRYNGIVLFSGV